MLECAAGGEWIRSAPGVAHEHERHSAEEEEGEEDEEDDEDGAAHIVLERDDSMLPLSTVSNGPQ